MSNNDEGNASTHSNSEPYDEGDVSEGEIQSRRSFTRDIGKRVARELHGAKSAIMDDMQADIQKEVDAAIKRVLKDTDIIEATTEKVVKRSKENPVPEFRLKGNKQRFCANQEILEKIESGIDAIAKGELEDATEKLAAGKKLLLKQQKLIRIADRGGRRLGGC